MIHLMVLPNPDTLDLSKRPQHGGRDRHVCIGEPWHIPAPQLLLIQSQSPAYEMPHRSAAEFMA